MVALHVVPLVIQVLVPGALLLWLVVGRTADGATAVVRVLAVAAYLVLITLAGLWLAVPWSASLVYMLLLVLNARSLPERIRSLPWSPRGYRQWTGFTVSVALAVGSLVLSVDTIRGWRPAEQRTVELAFPLRSGTYYVVNGGTSDLINAHLRTLTGDRFRDYRGQSYGVDIVALNRLGLRASGIAPHDPQRYVIFGEPIHAPCSGSVRRTQDGLPDMSPPQIDREHLAGNFVMLECAGAHVLLGHMRQGTVRVRPGDDVSTGDVVGNVGNSGNTGEPHLHIHAQRPATGDALLSGSPLPLRLDGRFLVRNDRVSHSRDADGNAGRATAVRGR
jgi:hypothetical protein